MTTRIPAKKGTSVERTPTPPPPHTTAPASGQCGGAEGQHPNLLQVVGNVGVHCDRVELVAALTKLCLGSNNVANVHVVGFGQGARSASQGFVGLVGAEDASARNTAEQTKQLGGQGGGLQLVDRSGQLVTNMAEGVGAGTKLAQVVCGVGKTTVQQGHDLLVGSHVCRHQVAATATPSAVAQDLGFGGSNRVEEGHAHAGAAGTSIKGSVALDDAALDPLRLLEDAFRGVLKEFGAGNKVREESTPRIVAVKGGHWLAPVESWLAVAPQGLTSRLPLSTNEHDLDRRPASSFVGSRSSCL
jgi:hypothetical protein